MSMGTYLSVQINSSEENLSLGKSTNINMFVNGKLSVMRVEQTATYTLHKLALPQPQLFIYHFLRTS